MKDLLNFYSEPVGVAGEHDGQAAEVPGGPGDEAVVEGEGGAGGHSEPVGVDGEPDGQAAEVPGGPGDEAVEEGGAGVHIEPVGVAGEPGFNRDNSKRSWIGIHLWGFRNFSKKKGFFYDA